MNTELLASLDEQIKAAHLRVHQGGNKTKAAILETVNAARECGLYIGDLCEQENRSVAQLFNKTITSYRFGFNLQTARIYRRLAEANPDPITDLSEGVASLKDALIASGALAAPQGHASNTSHDTTIISALLQLTGRFRSQWDKLDGEQFIADITPHGAQHVLVQIEPEVERMVSLRDTLRTKAQEAV